VYSVALDCLFTIWADSFFFCACHPPFQQERQDARKIVLDPVRVDCVWNHFLRFAPTSDFASKSAKYNPSAMSRLVLVTLAALLSCAGCGDRRELRGSFKASQDGNTYLVVVDDNGGQCGPLKVDGRFWPQPIGQAGRIEPGHHTIECGEQVDFDIRPGVVFKFDYWGP
jgi:hypothetical protein